VPYAHWITPEGVPKRFDTWFYLAQANSAQLAVCDGWETVDAEWIAPAEAIRLAAAGERTVIFPTRMNLKLLAEASSGADAVARAKARKLVPVLPVVTPREGGPVLVRLKLKALGVDGAVKMRGFEVFPSFQLAKT